MFSNCRLCQLILRLPGGLFNHGKASAEEEGAATRRGLVIFGDILSDLGPACTGTIGIAPSANLNPERVFPSMFEPVHGSAPDIAGKGSANPIGQIWAGAMMLEHLGEHDAARAIIKAIEKVLESGPKTRDIGGSASTEEVGKDMAAAV